jgi:hypothetical protein
MKTFLIQFGLFLVTLAAGIASVSSAGPSLSADEALQKLMDGNKR